MIETLKARKEQLEARGVKGFTLMEMLIVIAIIAVLIAIAIPVFTAQLDSAEKATTEANGRALYAMLAADYMDSQSYDTTGITANMTITSSSSDADATVNDQVFAAKGKYQIVVTVKDGTDTVAPTVEVTDGSSTIAKFGQSS